ncbi:MAG: RusA family crossover junction endodeoxyribonuclease [Mycobacterium sp.]
MTEPVDLRLPYPPSVNRYWRVWRNRAVRSPAAKKFQREVREVVARHDWPKVPGEVRVLVELRPASGRKPDIDNAAKALLDALADAKVIENDRHVVDLHLWRGSAGDGVALVTVESAC